MTGAKIMEILDAIESLIERSKRVPLSSKVIVDAEQLLDLVDDLRIALPDAIKDAQTLLADRDRLLTDARMEAERLLGSARQRMQELIKDSEIGKKAREYAQEIVTEARSQAEEIRKGADSYAASTLKSLLESLARAQKVVEKGIEELNKREMPSGNASGSTGTPVPKAEMSAQGGANHSKLVAAK
ncbi:MAG TPA: ATP synthase F0 subunit B [Firmicutes bacterium]|nr:hypothetical protein [Bacillota bacterium]HHY98882.1 ATP synthase F0 subunit B [Bacillota bacterium]